MRLVVVETIGTKRGHEVHDEVVDGAVTRVDERLGVLQRVVDALDDIAFAQHYLVPQRHEPVLHVGLYASDEVYAVGEEVVEEPLRDVSTVGEQPAV